MDRQQLKELIEEVYEDFYFAEFNLHFVDTVESHKVYEIKNNRINNKLKDTTLIAVNAQVSDEEMKSLSLYGINIKEVLTRQMIESSASKILTDIYKVAEEEWINKQPIEVELTIANWYFNEERVENGIVYSLRFEVA